MGAGDGVRLGGRGHGRERLAGPQRTLLQGTLQALVGAVVAGGCAYFLLVLVAVRRHLKRRSKRRPADASPLSFSLLKPLAGEEEGLDRNLNSFYQLDYPAYEILFAARRPSDPALATARSVARRNLHVHSTVLAVGEPSCQNAKVHSLEALTEAANGQVLVISDSDIRTDRGLLRQLAAEFEDPDTGVVTCPYRAVPGRSPWSLLEALGMNTGFWSGVLAAQFVMPMDFAVGPTMAVRRSCLKAIGGWRTVQDMLAEDFQVGRLARQAGYEVRLGSHVVEHRIGSQGFAANLAHRLRWSRSTRRSRPVGYFGEIFANPLPWALLLAIVSDATWASILVGTCALLRLLAMLAVGWRTLGDTLVLKFCWLVPLQDTLALLLWAGGFFGNRIVWREKAYKLARDGRLRRLDS